MGGGEIPGMASENCGKKGTRKIKVNIHVLIYTSLHKIVHNMINMVSM